MALLTESQQKEARKVLLWSFVAATILMTLLVGGCAAMIAVGSANVERADKEIHPASSVFVHQIEKALQVRISQVSRNDLRAKAFANNQNLIEIGAPVDFLRLEVEVKNTGTEPVVKWGVGPQVRCNGKAFEPVGLRKSDNLEKLNPGFSSKTDYYYLLPSGSLEQPLSANLNTLGSSFWVELE